MANALAVIASGSPPAPPGEPTIVSVSVVDGAPDASGNPQKQITLLYSPPIGFFTGTFAGIWAYLDAPDSSGGLSIADGTIPADGTTGASSSFAPISEGFYPFQTSNPLVNTQSAAAIPSGFQTVTPVSMLNISVGMYLTIDTGANAEVVTVSSVTASTFSATFVNSHITTPVAIVGSFVNQIQFLQAAPTQPQYWRVYIVGGSANIQIFPVEYGLPGASPSEQFYVGPPAGGTTGQENAPNVINQQLSTSAHWPSGWTANPNVYVASSGDQYFDYEAQWDWPTQSQNFQILGGVNLVLSDGIKQTYIGNAASNSATAYYVSVPIPVPQGATVYTLYLISYDVNGNNNSLVVGVTPSIVFSVTRNVGPSGEEYCALVLSDGVHPFVTAVPALGADGTAMLQVDGYWTNPSDPSFAGAEIDVLKPDGNYYTVVAGRISPIENFITQPASVQSWTFYLRSVDINGLRNSIVNGVTPSVTISVGSAVGQLNLTKVQASTFSNQFAVVAGAFTVTELDAGTIITGNLQVGGGSGMVSSFKIFDAFGDIIGFIGDGLSAGYGAYIGAWFKECWIGGANPATAPLVCSSTGAFTIAAPGVGGATTSIGPSFAGVHVAEGVFSANYYSQSMEVFAGTSGTIYASLGIIGSGPYVPLVQLSDGTYIVLLTTTIFEMQGLPSASPGSGTKQFWYDPTDSNRVKFSA